MTEELNKQRMDLERTAQMQQQQLHRGEESFRERQWTLEKTFADRQVDARSILPSEMTLESTGTCRSVGAATEAKGTSNFGG